VLEFPQDENAWLALGMTLDQTIRAEARMPLGAPTSMLPEAVEAYQRSLTLRPDAKTWNNLGVDLDLLNRFDDAERAFAEALVLEPAYAMAWLNLGCARLNAHRYALAAKAFQQGLALRPDEANAWVRLAHCQRLAGQREAALATMRIALRYRPLAAELWLDLGLLMVEAARLDEAQEIHARLVAMDPEVAVRLQAALKRSRVLRPAASTARRQR
jgi:tetratricopeptide (TPR) repeat protein